MNQQNLTNTGPPSLSPGQRIVHRVRNEATEKHLSDKPWCGAQLNPWPYATDTATILDTDVTCPACLQIIASMKKETRLSGTHYINPEGSSLCGAEPNDVDEMVDTFRDTRCEKCLDIAENLLVGILSAKPQESSIESTLEAAKSLITAVTKPDGHNEKIEQSWQEQNEALRDIAEMLKELAVIWRGEFEIDRIEREPGIAGSHK